jgi:FAD dependent oxidoreductase.
LPVAENFDRLIVCAGLGSAAVTASLNQLVDIRPVLGQALHLLTPNPVGNPDFSPVITCDDVHIVPVGNQEFWVGATVEFSENGGEIQANSDMLEQVMARAIALCPALADAEIIRNGRDCARGRKGGRPQLSGRFPVTIAFSSPAATIATVFCWPLQQRDRSEK